MTFDVYGLDVRHVEYNAHLTSVPQFHILKNCLLVTTVSLVPRNLDVHTISRGPVVSCELLCLFSVLGHTYPSENLLPGYVLKMSHDTDYFYGSIMLGT